MLGHGLGLGFSAGGVALSFLASVANHTDIPNALMNGVSSTNYVDHSITGHKIGTGVVFAGNRLVYHNALYHNDTESPAPESFNMRVGVYYNGTWYPVYFSGSRDVLVDKNYGTVISDPIAGLTLNAAINDRIICSTRRITTKGAAQTSFSWNYNVVNGGSDGGMRFQGTDPNVDYTLGVGLPFGTTFGTPVISGGGIASVPVTSGGVNMTSAVSMGFYYGWAGAGNAGALYAGSGAGGYLNVSGGAGTNVTMTSNGTGYSGTPPIPYFTGGAFAENGGYAPVAILGTPLNSTPSVMILGDSYTTGGVVSPDMVMGPYEHLVRNYGYHRMGVNGATAFGFTPSCKRLALLDQMITWGYRPTHCINALGVNDFWALGTTAADIIARVKAVNDLLVARGMKVTNVTVPPRTTSTDSWATTANQTVHNANYASGGTVQQYNGLLKNKTGITWDSLVSSDHVWRDQVDPTKWPVALYGSGSATGDGVHPNGTAKQLYADNVKSLDLESKTWPLQRKVEGRDPSNYIDFVNQRYALNGVEKTFAQMFTFTRGGSGTYVGSDGLIKSAANGAPRFDYDPITLEPKGLLIEESRTNFATYSSDLTNASWGVLNSTALTGQGISPDGTNTANFIQENTATGSHGRSVNYASTDVQTFSFYAKAGTRSYVWSYFTGYSSGSAWFNLESGTLGTVEGGVTATILPAGNGWYRCSLTKKNATNSNGAVINMSLGSGLTGYTGDGVSGLYIWGVQLERGSASSSYIPTTTASITRPADIIYMTDFSWDVDAAGTFYTDFYIPYGASSTSSYPHVWNYSSANGTIEPFFIVPALHMYTNISRGGTQASFTNLSQVAGTRHKCALGYEPNNVGYARNGVGMTTDIASTIPTGANVFQIGAYDTYGNYTINSCIREILYYPHRISDANLITQTA